MSDYPCLRLAIVPLTAAETNHYATYVLEAPYPGGHAHHDRLWVQSLTQAWDDWQSFFASRQLPLVPRFSYSSGGEPVVTSPPSMPPAAPPGQPTNYTGMLMQHLGISLWQWLFNGPIENSFEGSQGIAIGQRKPLRLQLEIRDPDLIALPWEIMQAQAGRQSVSLSQQLLFSRTTYDVDVLPPLQSEQSLRVLLVLGQDGEVNPLDSRSVPRSTGRLNLEQEAESIAQILEHAPQENSTGGFTNPAICQVTTLVEPTPAELKQHLENNHYNVFFYSGHGAPAPDGGLLFLRSDATINGTELAQVLIRSQVKLSVFNTCWGAQPDHRNGCPIPRSSLAEVLIHHGVPAVLAMRDTIANQEAMSFIQELTRALAARSPIDEAVAIARQHLLVLYHYNQPAWTLPVLYMHPDFNGELIQPMREGVTEIPDMSASWLSNRPPIAFLRSMAPPVHTWPIQGGIMRIGSREDNDLVIPGMGVSRSHAQIVCRDALVSDGNGPTYFLQDFSRYGTQILTATGWHRVNHQEVPLPSRTQVRFGYSQTLEFVIESESGPIQN